MPILPGLVRYDEAVIAGEIKHALRFTVQTTQRAYLHPATHYASSNTSPSAPPMGLRVRLKASYDLSRFTGASKAILTALKKYGMLVADNGSDWFISEATDARRTHGRPRIDEEMESLVVRQITPKWAVGKTAVIFRLHGGFLHCREA